MIDFVASGTTSYIGAGRNNSGECAFRVRKLEHAGLVEPKVSVTINVDDPADAFNIQYSDNGGYIHITADDRYSYFWYVDGECVSSWYTYYNLYTSNHESGLYTITVERPDSGYSASIYVEIE